MKIKLKRNQKRENLIFNVKKLATIYDCTCTIDDIIIGDHIQDVIIATTQNNLVELVQALKGLRNAIDKQEYNDLGRITYRILGQVDIEKEVL